MSEPERVTEEPAPIEITDADVDEAIAMCGGVDRQMLGRQSFGVSFNLRGYHKVERYAGRLLQSMIRRASAIRFNRKAESGRTEPLRATVVTDDADEERDVILKVSAAKESSIESLSNEMLGAMLAADLGLPVAEPLLVFIDEDFIASIPVADVRVRLQASSRVAFAASDLGKQWRRWQSSDRLKQVQYGSALAVLAFDAFVGNSDRSPHNPNLMVKGDDWRLIDHEAAFSFRLKLFPRCQPWVLGNLHGICAAGADSEHVFAAGLMGKSGLDFGAVQAAWSDLSDVRLSQYDAVLPEEWEEARPYLAEAIGHLRHVRDNVDLCLTELKRVLS